MDNLWEKFTLSGSAEDYINYSRNREEIKNGPDKNDGNSGKSKSGRRQ